jgi:uncharacterized protein
MTTPGLQTWPLLLGIGLVVGTISGSLGVGSGIVLVPALVYLLGFEQKSAQAMSLIVMAPMVVTAALRYGLNPSIHLDVWPAIILAVAAVAGAYIGTGIAFSLNADMLRKIFAMFIIGAGILMMVKK